mmetsp:Transcript_36258/g.58602  ORF Transcript_36258/g.58602 Transcript_36258/m.58602 type:complete len:616 (-) Transcript_36258:1252-3099(-)
MSIALAPVDTRTSAVELSISCNRLVKLDSLSESDPFCIVYMRSFESQQWKEVGKTETITNCANPKFVTTIKVDYFFEENQPLRFVVYDRDSKSNNLKSQDLIGEASLNLGEVIGARGQAMTKELTNTGHPNRKNGSITVFAEEVRGIQDVVKLHFSAQKLPKRGLFSSTLPFLVLSRSREDGSWAPVFKTEQSSARSPVWRAAEVSVQRICNGDPERPLLIEVMHYSKNGNHKLLGRAETSLNALIGKVNQPIELSPSKGKPPSSSCGYVVMLQCQVDKVPSFLDYIAGGCEISLVVAIDFTASNGPPTSPDSLHFNSMGTQLNQYQSAILAVGEILANYDSDQRYPAYGFGAMLPPTWNVSHCFALNANPLQPECMGINGIMDAYAQTLSSVRLHGPTVFGQVISHAASIAATQGFVGDRQCYYILLIITDGEINDMDGTIGEIVRASGLPLSIIIVGVGNANFSNMRVLDADDQPLVSNGKRMERDIVQFVPFNQVKSNHYSRLAKEVLAEVPSQFLSYVKSKGIAPRPPIRPVLYNAAMSTLQPFNPLQAPPQYTRGASPPVFEAGAPSSRSPSPYGAPPMPSITPERAPSPYGTNPSNVSASPVAYPPHLP